MEKNGQSHGVFLLNSNAMGMIKCLLICRLLFILMSVVVFVVVFDSDIAETTLGNVKMSL